MSQQLNLFESPSVALSPSVQLGISGLEYLPSLLEFSEQQSVLDQIDRRPWRTDLKRRVQHYGYRYDYKARRVDRSMFLGSLPDFAVSVADQLVGCKLLDRMPDQLIINEYLPGQGITAHIDCEPCFAERIAMVSLGWAYEMDFINAETLEVKSILLETGSAASISGDARYKWLHQIKPRKTDRGIARKRRVSLTFRNVIIETMCPTS